MFPVEVSCPQCSKSLMDPINPIEGFPSINLFVSAGDRTSELWLSALYGSYRGRIDIDITGGRKIEVLCPHCNSNLVTEEPCKMCGAGMVFLMMDHGGMITFCSRFGCKNHAIAFGDLGKVVVGSVMNRYIVTVNGSYTLFTAAKTLIDYDIFYLPVMDDDGTILGYLTDMTLLQFAYPSASFYSSKITKKTTLPKNLEDTICQDAQLFKPVIVEPEMRLLKAAEIIAQTNEQILLIQKEGTMVGILTKRDLDRALLREKLR